ncbi:MAG: epsD [Frankiales bacterium]|nr:epsD [Frankiales bacterium]
MTAWPLAGPRVVPADRLPPQPPPRRVKVLHVITRFWAGAGGNTLLSATGMDPERYETWVAGCPGGELWERARAAGVRTVELDGFSEVISPRADVRVLWDLYRLARREQFTVVHTHSAKGGFLGRLAARAAGTPVVVHTFHGFSVNDGAPLPARLLYGGLERLVRSFTHGFAAVSPLVAREAVERHLAPPGTVAVVPSAVELEGIPSSGRPELRVRLGIPLSAQLVGTVGRIDHQKAPLDFVRVAAAVARQRPGTRFVMVGDGPLRDAVETHARAAGVDVLLTGHRTDAAQLASCFDVFLIPSLYEGLGRALTEALASGRPVVATAVNGVPDLVEAGITGLLAPPRDVAALAECVVWLLDHPQEAEQLGRQGQLRARAGFSQRDMCVELDALYSRLLCLPVLRADPESDPRPPASPLPTQPREAVTC